METSLKIKDLELGVNVMPGYILYGKKNQKVGLVHMNRSDEGYQQWAIEYNQRSLRNFKESFDPSEPVTIKDGIVEPASLIESRKAYELGVSLKLKEWGTTV